MQFISFKATNVDATKMLTFFLIEDHLRQNVPMWIYLHLHVIIYVSLIV